MKRCLLLVGLLFAFTSCSTDTASKVETETTLNNTEKNIQEKDISGNTIEPARETPASMGNKTAQPKDADVENSNPYGFFYDVSNPNKEYINNLKYLDEIEAKIQMAATTVDMVTATGNALNAWDKELNKIYALLLEKLSTEDSKTLKSEERLWMKERDKAANEYGDKFEGGSFSTVAYNDTLFQYTKQRTLELIHRYYSHNYDINQAMKAYRAVLQNEAEFFSIEDNKDDYLENSFFSDVDMEQVKNRYHQNFNGIYFYF